MNKILKNNWNIEENSDIQNNLQNKIWGIMSDAKNQVLDITHFFLGSKNDIEIDESINKVKLAIEIAPENFKNFILNEISNNQALTNWQEWEIYKIKLENKNYIIAKKRFDNNSQIETELQNYAFKLSKESKSWVKVPEIFYEFSDWNNGYIVMEYIEWKTLYTIIWEEMVNSQLIPLISKLVDKKVNNWEIIYKKYLGEINEFKKLYWNWNKIVFNNDYESQSAMRTICWILYDLWYIDWNFDSYTVNKISNERYYWVEQKLLNDFLSKIQIFDEDDKEIIVNKIKIFLDDIHKKWFYHRDLWKNFRNIMINWTDVTIIDFWRSVTNMWPNFDYEKWHYTKDNDIIANINRTNKDKKEEKNTLNIDYSELIEKWKNLGLNITEKDIILHSNFKNLNIEKVLDDFINLKDNSYDWFIYLSSKVWGKDFDFKNRSTNKWKTKLFILINLLDNDKIESLKNKIDLYSQESSKSKKRRYAELFKSYI